MGIDFVGFNLASASKDEGRWLGSAIPNRSSVTPVAMQTGVRIHVDGEGSLPLRGGAPVVHLTLRCAERGIGSRFAWQPG